MLTNRIALDVFVRVHVRNLVEIFDLFDFPFQVFEIVVELVELGLWHHVADLVFETLIFFNKLIFL